MAIYRIDDRTPEIDPSAYIHEHASVIGSVTMEAQSSVWPNATVRADSDCIRIGAGSNVQDGAVLHADPGFPLEIGLGVTVGHQAMLHGCSIGDGCLVGIQSVVLNGAKIGRGCLIGAGSLIPEGKVFPENSLIMGRPAKVVRTLDSDDADRLRIIAQHYVARGALYHSTLERIS